MKNRLSTFTLITILTVFALVGCGPQIQTGAEAGVNIEMEAMGDEQAVGETMLTITLTDANGEPINDASLNIQGDMTHGGMVPVIRDVEGGEDGVYTVPFEWTMGGDWIVTVLAVLSDGTEVEENFDLSVASEGDMAMDHSDHGDSEEGHDDHADHGDHDDAEMAMDSELVAAVEALDVSAIHAIDEDVNETGVIEADYAETVESFMMAVSMIEWPEMYSDDVDTLNQSLNALKEALENDELETVQAMATEVHDVAHHLIDSIVDSGEEHDHGDHGDSEEEGHDDHGDHGDSEEGHDDHADHGDAEMAMDSELVAAVEALDVSAIHAIDDELNETGVIEADYAETVSSFTMAVSMIEWPEMYSEEVESLNKTLASLQEALETEELEAAQSLATEAHDIAHHIIDSIVDSGEEHEH